MNKAIFIPDSWGIPKNIGTTELVRQVQEKRSLNRKDHEIALECWLTDLNAKSKQTSDNKWICFFDTVSHFTELIREANDLLYKQPVGFKVVFNEADEIASLVQMDEGFLYKVGKDFGITTDTLECTVNWSNMEQVHADVRKICHALPNTVVTTHMSHCYPQGANLYFIFLTRMQDEDAFKAYHTTILDAIQRSGAAVSHHHGIGKMFAPWLEGYIGEKEYGVFRVLKNYFDPDYNMNPGGTIGLDLKPEEKKFLRDYTDYLEQPKFD